MHCIKCIKNKTKKHSTLSNSCTFLNFSPCQKTEIYLVFSRNKHIAFDTLGCGGAGAFCCSHHSLDAAGGVLLTLLILT